MKTTIKYYGDKFNNEKSILTLDNDDLNNLNFVNLKIFEETKMVTDVLVLIDDLDSALEGFKHLRKTLKELD